MKNTYLEHLHQKREFLQHKKDSETHGRYGLKEGELHYKKHFKTYPTHRLYGVVVYKSSDKQFSYREKRFFREYLYSLLTSEHDFSKSFVKQVSGFFRQTKEGSKVDSDGKFLYTYTLLLNKPVKLKLEKFNEMFKSTRSFYKLYGVNGKTMNMGTSSTKLRTKDDSKYYNQYNETQKLVA